MAAREASSAFDNLEAAREGIIRRNVEPQLKRLGLSVEQIEKQTLGELEQSLTKINDGIADPETFGPLKLGNIELGILPLLLERKSLILSRIKSLVGEQRIESLQDLVATVADPELRAKIKSELSSIAEHSRRAAEQEIAAIQAQAEQITKRDVAVATLSAELFERRLHALTGFFTRESMATYVGAFLLIVLTFVQVVAMFLGATYKSEIISNAFLLLLGYFFGQSVARTAPRAAGQVDGSG
jgi:hypothetical protein